MNLAKETRKGKSMKFILLKKKHIYLILTTIAMCILLMMSWLGGSKPASLFFGYTTQSKPIERVSGVKNAVALSFDIAWGDDKSVQIARELKKMEASATFFIVGFFAQTNVQTLVELNELDQEIGLHSHTHADFRKLTYTQIQNEILFNQDAIYSAIKQRPKKIRLPYDGYNKTILADLKKDGYDVIGYAVDGNDIGALDSVVAVEQTVSKIKAGDIIRLHTINENIVDIVLALIARLKIMGIKCVSVAELLAFSSV